MIPDLGCVSFIDRRWLYIASTLRYWNNIMAPYTHHIFICCNQRDAGSRSSCDPDGEEELQKLFKKEVKKHDLNAFVRANKAGCLDQCELGPVVVIYPQGIWYGGVKLKDVSRIIEETVIGGRILEDLRIPDKKINA